MTTDRPRAERPADHPAPRLEDASPECLADLLNLDDSSMDVVADPPVQPATKRPRVSRAGIVFALVIAVMVSTVGWWSWRMMAGGGGGTNFERELEAVSEPNAANSSASPWLRASRHTLIFDSGVFALEAAYHPAGNPIVICLSDGSQRIYNFEQEPVSHHPIESAATFPMAARYNRHGQPEAIDQAGQTIIPLGPDIKPGIELPRQVSEVYIWDADRLVGAPATFDGSLLVRSDQNETVLPGMRYAGFCPFNQTVLTTDRTAQERIGILAPNKQIMRTIEAPQPVREATLSPDGSHITALLTSGEIVCLNASNAELVWQREPVPDLDRPIIRYLPSGELILAEHRILLLAPEDGRVLADLTPDHALPLAAFDLVLAPDGQSMCVLGNTLYVISLRD